MKKAIALFMVMALVVTMLPVAAAAAYSDLDDHWASAAIERWSDSGIVQGSDGEFRPEDPITRGEMAAIIDRLMQYQTLAENAFSDLDENFYTAPILKANAAGVISGYNSLVRPNDEITREEAVVMLGRAFGIVESDTASDFSDSANISSWALGYVNSMAARGLINGIDGAFCPQDSIKRAEVVTILNNAISTVYSEAAEYSGDVSGIVIINAPGVTLKDMVISGDLIIAEGVGDGDVTLSNVTVTGNTIVRGGGANSIHIEGNSSLTNIIIEKTDDGQIRVINEDGSIVDAIYVDDGNDDIILAGEFGNVTIAAGVTVRAAGATVGLVDITDEDGQLILDENSVIDTLRLNTAATVQNNGTIKKAEINVEGAAVEGNAPGEIHYAEGVPGEEDTNTGGGWVPVDVEAEALAYAVAHTTLRGDLSSFTATFPTTVPAFFDNAGYKINSQITLSADMDGVITITRNGGTPRVITGGLEAGTYTYTELVDLFNGAAGEPSPADFTNGIYGGAVETYTISVAGDPAPINTTVTIQSIISDDDFETKTVLAELVVGDTTAPTLNGVAFKANDTALEGSVAAGYTLITDGNADTNYVISFDGTTSSEALAGELFGLYLDTTNLTPDQIAALTDYYNDKPADYKDYLVGALAGTNPFAYIQGNEGGSVTLLDAAQYVLTNAETEIGMVIPGNYPLGSYVLNGTIEDVAGNTTDLTYTLIVTDIEAEALAYAVAHTTLSGDLSSFTATFPTTVPAFFDDAGYKINSQITLAAAVNGEICITGNGCNLTFVGGLPQGTYTFTELYERAGNGALSPAGFTHNIYDGRTETYTITITGNTSPINTTVTIQSIISDDDFETNTVLAELTDLPLVVS